MGRGTLTPQEEELKKVISNNIRTKIKEEGISQAEFARRAGIPPTTLSGYIKGVTRPNAGNLQKISDTLGLLKSDIDPSYKQGYSLEDWNNNKKQSHLVKKITEISSRLEEPRQKVVLDTATNQLEEQNKEKEKESKVIPINKIPDDLPPYISRKILENFVMPTNTMEYEPDEDMVDVPILGRIAAGLPLDAVENFDGTRPVPAHFLSSARDYYWLMVDGHSMEPKIPFGSYVLIEAVPDVSDGTIGAVLFHDDCQATLKKVYHEIDCLRLVSINKEFKDQFATQDNPAAVIGQAVKVEIDL
ncbi:XRE family transcriptional regulator [Lactococcus lactis]|uniref:XRE family transcriptional regulator n=1 Tax=Lactococcus lactis TaxID=1358 RepID=UPI0032AF41A4